MSPGSVRTDRAESHHRIDQSRSSLAFATAADTRIVSDYVLVLITSGDCHLCTHACTVMANLGVAAGEIDVTDAEAVGPAAHGVPLAFRPVLLEGRRSRTPAPDMPGPVKARNSDDREPRHAVTYPGSDSAPRWTIHSQRHAVVDLCGVSGYLERPS